MTYRKPPEIWFGIAIFIAVCLFALSVVMGVETGR